MDGERIGRARARIEAAVDRIEAAAEKLSLARQAGGDSELEARYNALRAEAVAALAGIDTLISRLDPDNFAQDEADTDTHG